MIHAALVALASELAFAFGIVIGSLLAQIVSTVIDFVRQSQTMSLAAALSQGIVVGLAAGLCGFWVSVVFGRYFGVPDSWLIWLAVVPPCLGEFGHFLNSFSLRHLGKPHMSVFTPLGRVHAAAWEFFKQPTFRFWQHIVGVQEQDPEKVGRTAYRITNWCTRRAFWGLVVGVALSIWWLSTLLHVSVV